MLPEDSKHNGEQNSPYQSKISLSLEFKSTSEANGEGGEIDTNDQNYQYYKEYCRLYYANLILTNRLQQLLNEKQDLTFKLTRLEVSKGSTKPRVSAP